MAIINRANGTTYQLGIDGKKILALLDDRIQVNSDSDKLHEDKDKNQEEYFWGDFWSDRSDIYIMIGNGFDLECGLPTSYTDYLNFIKAANMVSSGTSCEALPINSTIKDKLLDPNCNISFWQKMANNYWIHHFNKVHIRSGWVDFESEIAKVIRTIETSLELTRFRKATLDDYVGGMQESDLTNTLGEFLKSFGIRTKTKIKGNTKYIEYNILYRELRDTLLNDLNDLISGFEKYLFEFVEPLPVKITDNVLALLEKIKQEEFRYVISFNYTTTLERLLKDVGIEAKYCYVHGKIGDGKSKNNMVLGIDEYLPAGAEKELIGFAPFRKYNQRIFKGTDSNYMDWLADIPNTTWSKELYIFGHSLGITDKDIIEPFVKGYNMKTRVFYHNDDSFSDIVCNLTAIIGMDEMIKRTGGSKRTMDFIKQTY